MWLPLRTDLPAEPRTPGRVRRLLTEWLHRGGCATDTADDLVLAVNEAVSNCVEHAYLPGQGGTVAVDAVAVGCEHGGSHAVVTVTDTGRWRAAPADTGFRGRGLAMVEATVQQILIGRTVGGGTQVRMTSHSCAPLLEIR
jgi:anti-sigma regulatory factor (Ser/Thr protein kinase)